MAAPLVKWKEFGFKTPMARAKNLGSAHAGAHHWIAQRVTAILLLPLTFWLCWSIVGLVHADHAAFVFWLARPWNAILMIVTVITMFYHAALGCQVVIEDYIHSQAFMIAKLISMRVVLFITCVACIFAILKVAL